MIIVLMSPFCWFIRAQILISELRSTAMKIVELQAAGVDEEITSRMAL